MSTDNDMDLVGSISCLDQNVGNIWGSQLSALQLLLRVEQPEGQALPSYVYRPDIIACM